MRILLFIFLLLTSCSSIRPKREVVKLEYFITKKGLADNIKVIESSNDEYRLPAIRSLKKLRFNLRQKRSSPQYVKLKFTNIYRQK